MATDPVQMIRQIDADTPLTLDLPATLARLAALPPSLDAPYLTLTLDWRPQGEAPNVRGARRAFDDLSAAIRERYGPRGTAFDSVTTDLDRIGAMLNGEIDPAARGIVIVANDRQGVFETMLLEFPVANDLIAAPVPSLRTLAHAADDQPVYAVVVADQREAMLAVFERQTRREGVEVAGTDYPRKQAQGGWSQKRYQARADERIEAFARTVAGEIRQAFDERSERSPGYLVIGANDRLAALLQEALHETIREKVLGVVALSISASEQEMLAAVEPLIAEAERERELAAIERIREGVGSGGKGVAGVADTLTAVQTGQVMTLVMNADFASPGWADYSMPVFGTGEVPSDHPAGGDAGNLVAVALEDELVRLAMQHDAEIEIISTDAPVRNEEQMPLPGGDSAMPRARAAVELDALGGVGAVLRFALDAGQSTADL